jgi:uncharacterized protein (DUF4415 family)
MSNPKRVKFNKALKNMPQEKFASSDMLSADLSQRVNNLEDKLKVTMRLDARVIEEAKRESEKLGVGYQKIINDRLMEIYAIQEAAYLKRNRMEELAETIKDLEGRIRKLEERQKKMDL